MLQDEECSIRRLGGVLGSLVVAEQGERDEQQSGIEGEI
jgi:hypothetical protein